MGQRATSKYDLVERADLGGHEVAERKVAALEAHRSQSDTAEELAALRAAIEAGTSVFEGYTRVRPAVPAPHPKFDVRIW